MKDIASRQHSLVKYWQTLAKERQARYDEGRLLVEGKNLIFDLLKEKRALRLIVKKGFQLPPGLLFDELIEVNPSIIDKISMCDSPEGILAEMKLPHMVPLSGCSRVLVLDRIQDPGNLGTLFRTARALGWKDIFLIEGCCDPFNDKAVRAAKGASFFINIEQGEWDRIEALQKENSSTIVVADLHGEKPEGIRQDLNILLVLGNEAQGVSIPAHIHCKKVTIPIQESVESLNVAAAGAILMYTLRQP